MHSKKIDQDYWDNLYKTKEVGWDIGYPSPALRNYIDQLSDKSIRILIPGCGNAYEAEYLLRNGFHHVTLIDIAPQLTTALMAKFENHPGIKPRIITGDFFELHGQFDLILEHTFLSALQPTLRIAYTKKMHELLTPNGKLVGVLFGKHFEEDGPPFGGSIEEYRDLFRDNFDICVLEPCYNSIERRAGSEVFINIQPKPNSNTSL